MSATGVDPRPTLEAPDDDPFLWLEDIEGAAALDWVERQNRATLAALEGPTLTADRDALAEAEGEDWTWQGATSLPGSHDRALVRLSRGGGDAAVLRKFNLEALAFLPDGFTLPAAKGASVWLDRDRLLLQSALGEDQATRAGYPRSVRMWRRGEPHTAAETLFEVPSESVVARAWVDRPEGHERLCFLEQRSFFESRVSLGDRGGPRTWLDLPDDARKDIYRDWLLVKPRRDWPCGGVPYPADSLLAIPLSRFLAGARDFALLFEPGQRRSLQGFFWSGARLVVSTLEALAPRIELLTPGPEGWRREALPGIPEVAAVSARALDQVEEETNGEFLIDLQNPITPARQLLAAPGAAPRVLRRAPATFAAEGLEVARHEAVSVDGESIPYVQVGPPAPDGDAPVHMTAYGGFGVSLTPTYAATLGKLWLERGGTTVVANLRGGGEFGSAWHDAGRKAGKRLAHDDFAAVAADLVRRGVTRPDRIAAEGGSNGGLLIANMLTRYPERFGALFCTIPLVDMRRYTRLLAGHSWIDEYGDPDRPEDWAYLQGISVYHHVVPGRRYPPILIATTRKDDRVHPGHARKLAAKLQALGYDARFYEPAAGGHDYGRNAGERAAFIAMGSLFLRRAIGWQD